MAQLLLNPAHPPYYKALLPQYYILNCNNHTIYHAAFLYICTEWKLHFLL